MDRLYTMKEASKLLGLSVRHMQKLDKVGKIHFIRTPGGRRRISEEEIKRLRGRSSGKRSFVIYARVSSHEQKKKGDLDRQVEYLMSVISANSEVQVITDVGSGLNDERKGLKHLMGLIREGNITDVAITDKDRLTRFGFNYLKEFFAAFGVQIRVLNGEDRKSLEEEMVKDMLSIVTSFSGKLYGIRSAKRKKLLANVRKVVKEKEEKSGAGAELSSGD